MFLDATSYPEDISAADKALLPLAVEVDTPLYTYGEPTKDEKITLNESTTDCTTNALDTDPTFGEPEACHNASIILEICHCTYLIIYEKP